MTVVFFTGAGTSVASGVPTYRGTNGLWTSAPETEDLVTLELYLSDPDVRRRSWEFRAASPIWDAEPNDAHQAIADCADAWVITQNVDRLHHRAGSSPQRILELHGNVLGSVCLRCDDQVGTTSVLERVAAGDADPPCVRCGGVLKPHSVMFGEALDHEVFGHAMDLARSATTFVVVGSSLEVYPAASLVAVARHWGAEIIVIDPDPPADLNAPATVIADLAELAVPQLCTERGWRVIVDQLPTSEPVSEPRIPHPGIDRTPAGWPSTDDVDMSRIKTIVAEVLEPETAVDRLRLYYGRDSDYAGATFTDLLPRPVHEVTAADLLAVTLLGIEPLSPRTTRRLLDPCATRTDVLTALRRPDLEDSLALADEQTLLAMDDLYAALGRTIPRGRHDVLAPLCARLRPELFPVGGPSIRALFGIQADDYRLEWLVYRELIDDLLITETLYALGSLTRSDDDVQLDSYPLRWLDVLLWMRSDTLNAVAGSSN